LSNGIIRVFFKYKVLQEYSGKVGPVKAPMIDRGGSFQVFFGRKVCGILVCFPKIVRNLGTKVPHLNFQRYYNKFKFSCSFPHFFSHFFDRDLCLGLRIKNFNGKNLGNIGPFAGKKRVQCAIFC